MKKTNKRKKAAYDFLPIFGRHIFYGNDILTIFKLVEQYIDPETLDETVISSLDNIHGCVIPLVSAKDPERIFAFVMYVSRDADFNTVVHEANHLKNFIFNYVGQELDIANDEAESYLMGYLSQRFLELIYGEKPVQQPLKKRKASRKS